MALARLAGKQALVLAGGVLGLLLPALGWAGSVEYRYDALGRLVAVETATGAKARYDYDPAGNRTAVQVSGNGSVPLPGGRGGVVVVLPLLGGLVVPVAGGSVVAAPPGQ